MLPPSGEALLQPGRGLKGQRAEARGQEGLRSVPALPGASAGTGSQRLALGELLFPGQALVLRSSPALAGLG